MIDLARFGGLSFACDFSFGLQGMARIKKPEIPPSLQHTSQTPAMKHARPRVGAALRREDLAAALRHEQNHLSNGMHGAAGVTYVPLLPSLYSSSI